ncbi:MAG: Hsp20 family protein [Alphaproteobacteria bacterium]|nr:Hsp20 family protein [Alphaproteobacteria bacterium SS10]
MSGRLSGFSSPFLLGFDHLEQTLDRLSKAGADGYPPYNIEQLSTGDLRISIAVAGFTMDDLSIQLEDRQLVIRGKQQSAAEQERVFLHRGIAARQFQRAFLLADGIEVDGAHLSNGLLHVDLRQPEITTKVRNIEIRDGDKSQKSGKATVTIDEAQAS